MNPMMKKQVHELGSIEIIHKYGDESCIVSAARVSHLSKGNEQSDKNLITTMLKAKHMTPFRFAHYEFEIKLPIFVARQWMRHCTGSDFVEQSGRYTEMLDYYVPDYVKTEHKIILDETMDHSFSKYEILLSSGMPKEIARQILPLSTYTRFRWIVNLQALMHFLELRTDKHAQTEIRDYANALLDIVSVDFPTTMACWRSIYGK